jgi:poly(3-hydroxybutyrate) depolymerase
MFPVRSISLVRLWLVAGLLGAANPLAPPARAAAAEDFLYATIPKVGAELRDLPYRYLVPADCDPLREYPLIVFLHGVGECGDNNTSQLDREANGALSLVSAPCQAAAPCFMLAPQAGRAHGWDVDTLKQVARAIGKLEADYPIDHNRIYLTGISMGGGGAWRILTQYPFLFAAAVPMSGVGAGAYERIVGVPVWCFHALDDTVVGIRGSDDAISALRRAGGRAIYTRYSTGGHAIWPTAYATPFLRPWMLAQWRNRPMTGAPLVSITAPGWHWAVPPPVSLRSVAGTASIPGGVTKINWTFTPWVGGGGVDTSAYAFAAGTDQWLVTDAPVAGDSTLFLAIATGPSWATGTGVATGGGVTTLNDYFWNVPTGADLSAPSVVIALPTSTGLTSTPNSLLALEGTAAGAAGKTVGGIWWRNDRGGEGAGVGTTAWSICDIDLQPGDNLLTVTVRDSASITASTTLLVHAQFGGYSEWRLSQFSGADQTNDAVSGPLEDPDGDGLANILEYAFGTPPMQSQSGVMPVGAVVPGTAAPALSITHRRSKAANLIFGYEASADLVAWGAAEVTTVVEYPDVDGDGQTELVCASLVLSAGDARRFLRLRVSLP